MTWTMTTGDFGKPRVSNEPCKIVFLLLSWDVDGEITRWIGRLTAESGVLGVPKLIKLSERAMEAERGGRARDCGISTARRVGEPRGVER